MNNKENKKIRYLDYMRVIACLLVILVHTSAEYVVKDIGSLNFWVGNILDGLSRMAVPLFIMISGALLLDEDYKCSKKKLIEHIKKMLLFFAFWSLIYVFAFEIIGSIIKHEPIVLSEIIISFLEGHFHLWYVYLLIGFYLIVPLLRLWVKKENQKQVEYFILLATIVTFLIPQIINLGSLYLPFFQKLGTILNNKICLQYVGGYTAYFLLGWYLHNFDIKNKKSLYFLGMIGILITIIGTYILSITNDKPIQLYGYLTINVFFQSVMSFVLIKNKFNNSEKQTNQFIKTISKNSLGIYAIHVMVITISYRLLSIIGFRIAIINIPAVFLISLITSMIIMFFLSKIPGLRRVV